MNDEEFNKFITAELEKKKEEATKQGLPFNEAAARRRLSGMRKQFFDSGVYANTLKDQAELKPADLTVLKRSGDKVSGLKSGGQVDEDDE